MYQKKMVVNVLLRTCFDTLVALIEVAIITNKAAD